jgi:hypothetical protein
MTKHHCCAQWKPIVTVNPVLSVIFSLLFLLLQLFLELAIAGMDTAAIDDTLVAERVIKASGAPGLTPRGFVPPLGQTISENCAPSEYPHAIPHA